MLLHPLQSPVQPSVWLTNHLICCFWEERAFVRFRRPWVPVHTVLISVYIPTPEPCVYYLPSFSPHVRPGSSPHIHCPVLCPSHFPAPKLALLGHHVLVGFRPSALPCSLLHRAGAPGRSTCPAPGCSHCPHRLQVPSLPRLGVFTSQYPSPPHPSSP